MEHASRALVCRDRERTAGSAPGTPTSGLRHTTWAYPGGATVLDFQTCPYARLQISKFTGDVPLTSPIMNQLKI